MVGAFFVFQHIQTRGACLHLLWPSGLKGGVVLGLRRSIKGVGYGTEVPPAASVAQPSITAALC